MLMSLPYSKQLIPRAKDLRTNATRHEKHLWYDFLNDYPVRFQRQKTIGCFIADFYCARVKLVIELDGSQHFTEDGIAHDAARSAALEQYGITVLRFSNGEIDNHFEAVCRAIDVKVQSLLQEQNNNVSKER